MTIIAATAKNDRGYLTADSVLEVVGAPAGSRERAGMVALLATLGRKVDERGGRLHIQKTHAVDRAKLAVASIGTLAMAEGVKDHADSAANFDGFARTLPLLMAAMPPAALSEIYHVVSIGWSASESRVRGLAVSRSGIEFFDNDTVFHPDYDVKAPGAHHIYKFLRGGIWATQYLIPDIHGCIAQNAMWQVQQGRFAGRQLGGKLTTARVTKDGVELIENINLDEAAA